MKEGIYYHRYVLKSAYPLNARSQRCEIEGCLIRVGAGFGCIHPWPELGDKPLDDQLEALRQSKPLRLGKRALYCAELDGAARERGDSLFDGLTIPDSHLTVVPGLELEKKGARLFSRIKVKGSTDLAVTKKEVQRWLGLASGECRLRIDFNGALDPAVAMNLAQELGAEICERIEYIEDPIPFEAERWMGLRRQTGLSLAVDRACELAVKGKGGLPEWLVFKPAVVDAGKWCSKLKGKLEEHNICVTSYMDHAIGQMFAAYEAALLKEKYPEQVRECGLLTHGLFEKDAFFEALESCGPKLSAPAGTGLGFDRQLENLRWEKL